MTHKKVQKIKTPTIITTGKLHLPDIVSSIDYDELTPAFSFEYVQKEYCLSTWQSDKIKRLIEELAKLEKHKWGEIITQHIFQYKAVNKDGLKVSIPKFITPDMKIYYFKPFGKGNAYRIFGIRYRHNFKFLWFDSKHEIYP